MHPPKEAPKTDFLGVVFDTCLGEGLEDDILMEFDDFGLHLGVPGETILGRLPGWLQQIAHMVKSYSSKGQGSAAVLGLMELSRSCKNLQRDSSTLSTPYRGAVDLKASPLPPAPLPSARLSAC